MTIKKNLPTEKDFSGGAVQKYVFKETIQHPTTIIPLGIAGGFTGLMILGLMAINPITLIVPVAAGLLGGGAWVYNYGVRGKDLAARYVENLKQELEAARRFEIKELKNECYNAGFDEGCKEIDELEESYKKICDYLEKKAQSGNELDAVRYKSLARDIYKQGQKLLRSALEAYKALQTVDLNALKRDKSTYERQLKKVDENSAEAKSLRSRIKNHEDRIAAYDRHKDLISQSLAQLEEIEGTLENSYLELVDLAQGRGLITPAESISRLEQAVQAARKVESMLRGEDTSAEDKMYLDAGREKA